MAISVAVFNFKGGVGKTTTTLNLGAALAEVASVLLVDLDGQRTLSFACGYDGSLPTTLSLLQQEEIDPYQIGEDQNLHLIPGDIGLFQLEAEGDLFTPILKQLGEQYEIILFDCQPGLNPISVQAILTCNRILIPVICEPAVLKGLSEAIELIRGDRPDVPIDVVRCKYKPRLLITQEADQLLGEAAVELNYTLLKTTIPENIKIAEAVAHQQPVTLYSAKSSGSKAHQKLAKEVWEVWNNG